MHVAVAGNTVVQCAEHCEVAERCFGDNAVVVGVRGSDLHFSGINLRGRPAVSQRYVMHKASQGEMRSHGFFYRPDGADSGVLGLPVREESRPAVV